MQTLHDFERRSIRHPLERRTLTVSAVRDLGAALRRITLVGPSLDGFSADGPEDHVKVFFPASEAEDAASEAEGAASAPVHTRDFTPSRYRPEAGGGELDLDVVLHGDSAPASAWATAAEPGGRLTVGGPRGSRLLPRGIDSAVLIADATALPALARWARMLAAGVAVTAVVVSAADELDPYLAEEVPSHVALHRVQSTDVEERDAALLEYARDLAVGPGTFVWAAGEATALVPVRRHLRRERGLPAAQGKVDGYWRRGVTGLDHHAPLDASDPD